MDMNTATHTPTPWMVEADEDGVQCISHGGGRDGDIVTNIRYADRRGEADAAFIVRACNAHDELVALARYIEKLSSSPLQRDYVQPEVVQMARAALAKAGAA